MRKLTLNNRGGMIADFLVRLSCIPAATSVITPIVTSAIVCGVLPVSKFISNGDCFEQKSFVQLVSLKLNPINKHTTPMTIIASPTRSNSLVTCLMGFCGRGLRCRKKKRITIAIPPVGLDNRWLLDMSLIFFKKTHRLIQKHHRHETWSVKACRYINKPVFVMVLDKQVLTPPTKGPITLAIPHVEPMNPPYLPRLRYC